ncbi:family 43 glycosylhydrolase [Lewinella sp. IMCC34183]|uniref:glycoside hydrolase family 43 protein n=1 Tax=Lewinella sp. IMCC34183 TaxID=2248762 RepID=UPI000E253833|nr:glycoside hydrolase family 43 protein [Lewinella sp. IMCC34183]
MPYSSLPACLLIVCLGLLACDPPEDPATPTPDPQPNPEATFVNPVYQVGPDPWVFQEGDTYYVTYTTGRNITLIETDKMSGLRTAAARSRVVWNPPASGMNSAQIWAPEIHRIDGTWYVYYAASDGNNDNHRMWVLANTDADPLSDNWEDRGELELPDDKWAIDGSPVDIGGEWYFAWSGWEGDVNVQQDIYLAKMDGPTAVSGERVRLLQPEAAWEENGTDPRVVEGPQFIQHEGKLFMFYSAGGCWTDGYSLGAMELTIGDDPMLPESWSRLAQNPLFTSDAAARAYGPGHNSFFSSPDGTENWILYHANPEAGQGCGDERSMRMQPFTWSADGLPVLGDPVALGRSLPVPSGE